METELGDLNLTQGQAKSERSQPPQRSESTHDDGSTKDDRPLLKPGPTPFSHESFEDLEKKYAAFARHDVYGPLGCGELPLEEKVLLGIAAVTLVPIRLVLAMSLLILYYLICWICTLFSPPNREDGEQEDYAHMGGWRRAVIFWSGRFLSRVMLFVLGFYWIKETYRIPNGEEKSSTAPVSNLILFLSFYINPVKMTPLMLL